MKKLALLWDGSHVWGLMALAALARLGRDPVILTGDQVGRGALEGFDVLLVPGGWASRKAEALGPQGAKRLEAFIEGGGLYVGLCGGAGLILNGTLGPVGVRRLAPDRRLPNFSGNVRVAWEERAHPLCRSLPPRSTLTVWWPSQLEVLDPRRVKVLARYAGVGRGFMVADLGVEDVLGCGQAWRSWEPLYGIALDPTRLLGEPAMVEVSLGQGSMILSTLHLDDPESRAGRLALANLLGQPPQTAFCGGGPRRGRIRGRVSHLVRQARELIELGQRALVWAWRTPWILQWRRGVRGFEMGCLYVMLREAQRLVRADPDPPGPVEQALDRVEELLPPFLDRAKGLIMLDRLIQAQAAMGQGPCLEAEAEAERIREDLFDSRTRYGGRYRELLEEVDRLALLLLQGH